jgi:hypothetical protein
MSRFNFQSSGAAFTDEITKALALRKAEERQNMLDQLTVNAEDRAAQEAVRRQKESDSQLATSALAREATTLGLYDDAVFQPGEDVAARIGEEGSQLYKKWGRLAPQPVADVSSSTSFTGPDGDVVQGEQAAPTGPPPTPKFGFAGTKEDQERKRKRDMSAQLLISVLQDTKNPNAPMIAQKLEQDMLANDGIVTPAFVEKYLGPDTPIGVFHQETGETTLGGKTVSSAPAWSKIFTQSRPHVEPRPRNFMWGVNEDGDGVPIDQDSIPVDPNTGLGKLPPGIKPVRGGSGGNDSSQPLGISNSAFNSYIEEFGIAEPDEAGKIATGPMLAIRQRAAKIISEARTTPKVRDLAMRFIRNPDSIANESLNEKENMQFRQLLGVIAATPDVANLYRQNAIVLPKPKERGGLRVGATPTTPATSTATPPAPGGYPGGSKR